MCVCVCVLGGGGPALTFLVGINLFYRWEIGSNLLLDVDTPGWSRTLFLRKASIRLKVGHHLPTSETFRWRVDSGPTLNADWIAS